MPANEHPPRNWIGRQCTFDYQGKRLSGVVTEQRPNGYTARGNIPDWIITVQGQSGRMVEISLVESYTLFCD